jgi:2-keto-4-pentenoate hydratase/2-oxohepta-3-ene-1,7-dioic acid hydratase in catechol pathway
MVPSVRLVSYRDGVRDTYGAIVDDGVVEVPAISPSLPVTIREAMRLDPAVIDRAVRGREPDRPLAGLSYLPVIPNPSKIICVGVNYADHRAETSRPVVDYPTLFTRFADTQVGHEQEVRIPRASSVLDYEGELAVIIGGPAYEVDAAHALDHIAGYACYNDLTIRDWQRHTSQFTPGKNFVGVGSFGPWLVTPDEVELESLTLETRVNGQVRQSAPITDMIFSVPQLVAYITTFTPLDAGDVIVTGTPGGVGFFRDPPLLLADGDVVEVEISGIGILRNPITGSPE